MNRKQSKIPLLIIGLGGLLLAFAAIYLVWDGFSTPEAPSDQRITAEEVARVSTSEAYTAYLERSAIFVDVRGAESYDAGHIPGAVHIPLDELATRLDELSKQDWILTYCTWPKEETSVRAALILLQVGYPKVNPILGGLQAWQDAGYPLEPWFDHQRFVIGVFFSLVLVK